ncbi:MAG: Cof-type HAD-IIB family hydrolase [Defluviitaleaceae bacterium]|nr:Cof-type HAD-IIB family hydrolase [Defluviitaleaceae bacterium]
MGYRALFTDFDGTLYSGGKAVSEANVLAINAAKAAGRLIVLCSGRSWKSLAYYEKLLGFNTPGNYGVAFNGAVVYAYTENGHEILFRQTMEDAAAHKVIRELKSIAVPGVRIYVYGGNGDLYTEEAFRSEEQFSEDRRVELQYVRDFSDIKIGFSKVVAFGENSALRLVDAQMPREYGAVFCSDVLLEFLPPDVNKGSGMAFLAGHLGIPLEEVIAMGDECNDIPMLKKAGLGIAVANAVPAAKAAADIVLDKSCQEDAVKEVIERHLL